ncbi:MAG: amidohydrolase family protein, partial [Candidatus Kariarchaeaceae archaeon]
MSKVKIDAELAIIGDGESIANASIVIENDKIIYAGENEHSPSAETILSVPVVSPGFWDCHAHYFGLKKLDQSFLDPFVGILRCTWDVRETLLAGVTSVREVGGYGIFLKKAIDEGSLFGPRIYAAGNMISMTGGHGDTHSLPPEIYQHISSRSRITSPIADGIPECLRAVRTHLRGGAEIIKIS